MPRWDPAHYLLFADHRMRPGLELIGRIPAISPASVVDLGCGTGNLTAVLADRWPDASVIGIDSSPEMIAKASGDHPNMSWAVADVAEWEPSGPVDVLYSNATLHWLGGHQPLFERLRSMVSSGGYIAVQMPDNWDAPTHRVPADILDSGSWPEEAGAALMRDRLAMPQEYIDWLQPAEVDIWRTTYYQRLDGVDAVWNWVTGSLLRPVLRALGGADKERFAQTCKDAYRRAYPASGDGTTMVPFSRLFMVAHLP